MKPLKLLIVVPSGTHWIADFATSMLSLVGYLSMKPLPGYGSVEFRVMNVKGSILPNQRLDGLRAAQNGNFSHLLYVDSDHTFPPNMVHRLLAHNKDVMAVNCVTKTIPSSPTARSKADSPKGELVYSDLGGKKIEQVWRIGTGVMLLSRQAFMQIPHDAFAMVYKPDVDSYQGEDWRLCERMEEAGLQIFVDHELSLEVGHVGMLNYTHDYVGCVVREPVEEGA